MQMVGLSVRPNEDHQHGCLYMIISLHCKKNNVPVGGAADSDAFWGIFDY